MNYIGIGKIVLDSLCTEAYNIPHLHFILSRNEDGFVEAMNLEFGLVAIDKDSRNSVKNLVQILIEYIKRTIETYGFSKLKEVVSSDAMSEYWTEYRIFEFLLAEKKHDIGHEFVNHLEETIKNEIFEMYGISPDVKYSVLENAA